MTLTNDAEREAAIRRDCEHFDGIGTEEVRFLLSALDDARAEAASAKSDLCEIIAAYHGWADSASAPDFDAVSDDLGRLCSAIQDAEKVFGGSPVAVRETTE